jgi:hypothetical protein
MEDAYFSVRESLRHAHCTTPRKLINLAYTPRTGEKWRH